MVTRELIRAEDKTPLPANAPLKVDDKVQVNWHNTWYNASILEVYDVKEAAYVRYDNYGPSWDTWFSGDDIRPLASKNSKGKSVASGMISDDC